MEDQSTWMYLYAGLVTVAALLSWSNALYKNIFGKNLGESIRASVMKRMFSNAIFRKDVITKLENFQLQLNKVVVELNYNGGSTTKDVAKKAADNMGLLIDEIRAVKKLVRHNIARRDISDLHSERMIIRLNDKGSCFFINEKFLRDFEWTEKDVLEYNYEGLLSEEDLPDFRVKLNDAINRPATLNVQAAIMCRDGNYYPCRIIAEPIVIDEKLVELYGIIQISELVNE